ncbi:hypothetical protein K490DRAFT_69895 [Saccharata proteae CBS 121410]|uniref:Uncharacterized protein n=1 Tax=Saccharata proteae CBS 121410 TaxID=1314787 RepID=A0A9P4HPQ3_9PEZI|nr:hypothetical protein K490DRAFT_69895 [Saccharata proteae CBS 121410]
MRSVLAIFLATLLMLLGMALAAPIPHATHAQLDAASPSILKKMLTAGFHLECDASNCARSIDEKRASGSAMFKKTKMERTSHDEALRWSIF